MNKFEYFKREEAEQFVFYRIPKILFTHELYKKLSCDSKLLYGLMLDRMGLSNKNNWVDTQNRVFIYFTVEEAMDMLGCGKNKAVNCFAELDGKKGIGLIDRLQQGLGKPSVIYVKNCIIKGDLQKFKNQTSRSLENKLQGVYKPNFKEFKNQPPYIRKNDNDFNQTDISNINQSFNQMIKLDDFMTDGLMDYKKVINFLDNKLNYFEADQSQFSFNENDYLAYRNMIAEIFCRNDDDNIRINGKNLEAVKVKIKFMLIDLNTINYVHKQISAVTTKIKNVFNYTITALYRAPINTNVGSDLKFTGHKKNASYDLEELTKMLEIQSIWD